MKNKEIPYRWMQKRLGEVCKLKNGFAFKSNSYLTKGVPVIRISDIKGGIVSTDKSVRVEPRLDFDAYKIENNSILVAMSGATTGKFGIYRSNEEAYQNQRVGKFIITKSELLQNEFLYYLLNSLKQQIEKDAYGGAQPNISSKKIEEMQIPIPPLPEQHRIVAKIEELFSKLDNGVANLKKAKEQLKVYRQSVLKWAFEGRLTNENVIDGELPEGWMATNVGEVIDKPKYGTSKKCTYEQKGLGVLRIPNVVEGVVSPDDLKYASFSKEEREDFRLRKGDLLLIRSNGSVNLVGKCALIMYEDEEYLYAGYLIRLRPKATVIASKFLLYCLSSSSLREQIESLAKSTSGVNNINAQEIKSLSIPLPPIDEQDLIVQEIESRLSVADNLEKTIDQSLKQAEALRQSILKRAFEGRLVAQDTNDEVSNNS